MNLFMFSVLDEKEGYVKIKKDDFMESIDLIYQNGFEDGKRAAETRKEIEPSKAHFIGVTDYAGHNKESDLGSI